MLARPQPIAPMCINELKLVLRCVTSYQNELQDFNELNNSIMRGVESSMTGLGSKKRRNTNSKLYSNYTLLRAYKE